jgi:aerobic-type carbon monoxide dehydrogenase small subunit (CoxS/CutS family)
MFPPFPQLVDGKGWMVFYLHKAVRLHFPVKEKAMSQQQDGFKTTRRTFLKGMGVAAGAATLLPASGYAQEGDAPPATPGLRELGRGKQNITLRINGSQHQLAIEPRTTLLDALRMQLDLTGSKEICSRGSCGGCTVLVDGEAINSCLMLAIDAVGSEIVTIEGMAGDPQYKALIEAYCEHDAAQCGYCIPGFVVQSAAFLKETPDPTPEQIRQGISGNVCRCGTYSKIFEAIAAAAKGGMQ